MAQNLLTFGIFDSCAPGFRTATLPREVDMFVSQKAGRMSRILAIGAA
jgi:hypothetical protein